MVFPAQRGALTSAGEIVAFVRSWYNLAGVERVMGFATEEQVEQFYVACPQFERMLVQNGILLLKYWFFINDEEQEERFQSRIDCEERRWKLSPMDIESRNRWVEFLKRRTSCSPKRIFLRLLGSRSKPTTSVGHASTRCAMCLAKSLMKT